MIALWVVVLLTVVRQTAVGAYGNTPATIGLIDAEKAPPGRYYPISEETKERYRQWVAERDGA